MVKLFRHISRLLCSGSLMVAAGLACAQSAASYPNRPVRIIVPFAPGGSIGVVMHMLSERFRQEKKAVHDWRV